MDWNASNLNDEEFADEVAYVIGAFSSVNKWSVSKLRKILSQQKPKISQLKENLKAEKSDMQ